MLANNNITPRCNDDVVIRYNVMVQSNTLFLLFYFPLYLSPKCQKLFKCRFSLSAMLLCCNNAHSKKLILSDFIRVPFSIQQIYEFSDEPSVKKTKKAVD